MLFFIRAGYRGAGSVVSGGGRKREELSRNMAAGLSRFLVNI